MSICLYVESFDLSSTNKMLDNRTSLVIDSGPRDISVFMGIVTLPLVFLHVLQSRHVYCLLFNNFKKIS